MDSSLRGRCRVVARIATGRRAQREGHARPRAPAARPGRRSRRRRSQHRAVAGPAGAPERMRPGRPARRRDDPRGRRKPSGPCRRGSAPRRGRFSIGSGLQGATHGGLHARGLRHGGAGGTRDAVAEKRPGRHRPAGGGFPRAARAAARNALRRGAVRYGPDPPEIHEVAQKRRLHAPRGCHAGTPPPQDGGGGKGFHPPSTVPFPPASGQGRQKGYHRHPGRRPGTFHVPCPARRSRNRALVVNLGA